MQIPKKTLKLLNEQFYNELHASHIYFGMSAYFKRTPFQGFAKWMMLQAQEEMNHAMRIYDSITSRDASFSTDIIKKPEKDVYETPLEALKTAYEHEQLVTLQIRRIFEVASEEEDWVSADLMTWFLNEQEEEEHTTRKFVEALEFAGTDKKLILDIDKWAGKRAEP